MIIFFIAEIKSLQSNLTLEEILSNDAKLRNQVFFKMTNLTFFTNLDFNTYNCIRLRKWKKDWQNYEEG